MQTMVQTPGEGLCTSSNHPDTQEDRAESTHALLLPFNTVVTRRYASSTINMHRKCHQSSYKLHGNLPFQELQISIPSKSKDHKKQKSYAQSKSIRNIHKQLLVCLYQLYKIVYTHDGPSETLDPMSCWVSDKGKLETVL